MKIELKRITYNKRLSQETSAYAADIWVDGVKRGTVQNDGHGGPDMIHPWELGKEIDAYAKTLPQIEIYGTMMSTSAEIIFGDLLNAHLVESDLKRGMKTKTFFVAGDGKLYTVKGSIAPKDAVKVLNTLPLAEAVKLYMEHGG
jgi:hypothetical protein